MSSRLALNNLLLLVQYGVGGLVQLMLVPHIVRAVGLEQFGALAVALSGANYGAVVVQYAFQLNGPKHLAVLQGGDTEKSVFSRVVSAKLFLLSLVLPVLVTIGLIVPSHSSAQLISRLIILAALPCGWALHSGWYLQAVGMFGAVCLISIGGAIAALGLGFTYVDSHSATASVAAAAALCVSPVFAGVASFLVAMGRLSRLPGRVSLQSPWAEVRSGAALFMSQFIAALYGASGALVVGALAGLREAGAYSAVERVFGAIGSACQLTHTAAYPRLAQLYVTNRTKYRKLVLAVVGVYLLASTSVIVVVTLLWNVVGAYIFGPDGKQHTLVVGAALGVLLLGIFGPVVTGYLTVSGRARRVLPLTGKMMAVAAAVGIPGVHYLGGWAWMAAIAIAQIVVIVEAIGYWRDEAVEFRRIA